ncbi:uncharacterized protein LOC128658004 [Bombina bombina]|uniref:uncharacterized protein LOC128658004 n=1 Tax=Bombina bombina TaxID=8345 RepID=UPI00235A7FCB|nr:uncharacterized protein LOC128658004 [Bombina bombina]
MSDKNQTSDLPDPHGGCTDVTSSAGSAVEHGREPYVREHVKTEEDEVPINTATGHIDVTPTDGSGVEHRGEPYVCDQVKTEEHEFPINTATGSQEENPGTGLLNVKEEDETDDMNSHQTEIHWSLPADEDNADIVKVKITEDLFVRHQLESQYEETSDRISPGHMDTTPSGGTSVEHGGEPYVCDQVKTEEDEVPINKATGDVKTEVTLNAEQTNDLYVNSQQEAVKQEISDNISTGDVKTEVTVNAEQTNDLYVKSQLEAVKEKTSDNIRTALQLRPAVAITQMAAAAPLWCDSLYQMVSVQSPEDIHNCIKVLKIANDLICDAIIDIIKIEVKNMSIAFY